MNLYFDDDKSTIAAIVTGKGQAGVGIIRLSGKDAKKIGEQITGIKKPQARQAYFAKFKKGNGALIDEGLFLYFSAPNSFTGEDVVEFQGHGGSVVLNILLEEILKKGARQAEAGEFSARAFFNGKIDLVQAEAIADLIAAESKAGALSAINSMQGIFSKKVNEIIDEFINLRVYIEASIDFVDEDIDFLENQEIFARFKKLSKNLEKLLQEADKGKNIQEGFNIVLSGNPNVGKSSLLNALTGLDSAIVTNIEGTTRDVIKEVIYIKGIPIRIFDTAGIRETQNLVEAEGIRRAKQSLDKADQIFWLIEEDVFNIDKNIISLEKQKKLIQQGKLVFIRNKIDLLNDKKKNQEIKNKETKNQTNSGIFSIKLNQAEFANSESLANLEKLENLENLEAKVIRISAKQNLGIDKLLNFIEEILEKQTFGEDIFSARTRHTNSLSKASKFIKSSLENWQNISEIELFAEDLRIMQTELESITGKFTNQDLLTKIFSGFCIGK